MEPFKRWLYLRMSKKKERENNGVNVHRPHLNEHVQMLEYRKKSLGIGTDGTERTAQT